LTTLAASLPDVLLPVCASPETGSIKITLEFEKWGGLHPPSNLDEARSEEKEGEETEGDVWNSAKGFDELLISLLDNNEGPTHR